jgi:hypothetical protein
MGTTDEPLDVPRFDLETFLEDWAFDHPELVKYPEIFVRHVADYVFDEVLEVGSKSAD